MSIQEYTVWPVVELSLTLNTLENGSRPSGGVGHIKQGVPSIGGEHLTASGEFYFQNIRFIPEDYFAKLNRGVIQRYDVLVVKDGATTGKTAFVGDDFPFDRSAINEHVFILRPDASLVLPHFLFFFLYSDWGQLQIQREFQGAAVGGINQGFTQRLEIPLPPLPEQARIVAILRQADELRRLRQQARAKADRLLPALFHIIFGSPALWTKTVPLGECVDFVGGGTPSRKIGEYFTGDIPWATSKDIKSRYLDDAQEYITQEAIANSATKLVPPGTILLVVKSKILMHSLPIGITTRSFCFGQDVKGLVCKPQVSPQFIVAAMLAQTSRILEQARGVNTEGLTLEILRRVPIPVVDAKAQKMFVNLVKVFDEVEADTSVSQINLQKLFESLLGKAFSGELTAVYRTQHQAELQEAAAQRDITLDLRSQEPRLIDFEQGRVTPEEEAQFRQSVQKVFNPAMRDLLASLGTTNVFATLAQQINFPTFADMIRPALPTYANLVSDILADNLAAIGEGVRLTLAEHFTGTIARAIAPLTESNWLSSQTFYQSLGQHILALADAQIQQAVQQEPPQPTRAIHAQLDPTVKTMLQAIQTLSTYFTPAELHQLLQEFGHHFGPNRAIDLVQVEGGLHLLEASGFVRQVLVSERLMYRLIDPVDDGALLPTELAG